MPDSASVTPTDPKRKRTRSPAYPYINLEAAIARAKEFFAKEQRNAANINVAMKHWGFKEDSSVGAQTAAAVISFGLLQDEGIGDKRKVRLTQNALRILLDERPDSKERAELIRQAALAPKIHQQLWEKWGTDLPSDAQLKHTLLLEWPTPFNENAVDGFIREYRDTITFAKLSESDTVTSEVSDKGGESGEKYAPKIGDYVQWEHNGVLGFPESKRVKGISPDGNWAYVDGQHGAVPIHELIPASPSANVQQPTRTNVGEQIQSPPKTNIMQEFVVPLSDGSKAVFQWPSSLSKEDIDDLRDSLKIVERKIVRSEKSADSEQTNVEGA
jgi:hypothetical protein